MAGLKAVPPNPDEAEISIFGPGIGECVVIHLGNNQWMIVDSCTDRESHQPVALQYLQELDVDVANSVKLIVMTHWHDDHIKGAADGLAVCENAKFVCSGALTCSEFLEVVYLYEERSLMESSGVHEFPLCQYK